MLQLLNRAICNLIIDEGRMFISVHKREPLKGWTLQTTYLQASLVNMLPHKAIFYKLRK